MRYLIGIEKEGEPNKMICPDYFHKKFVIMIK
jgi:hypothetical protein